MATTENLHTGDASKTKFSFTFPYLNQTDVEVYVFATDAWVKKTITTHYTFANATTIKFGSAPAAATSPEQALLGDTKNIKVKRNTSSDALAATFYPGSAIRAGDLNDNYTQNLYVTQEASNAVTNANTDAAASVVTADEAKTLATTADANATTALNNSRLADGATPASPGGGYTSAIYLAKEADTDATAAVNTANAASAAVSGKLDKTGGEMSGNITMAGSQTVDGRDLSADGSKLDTIETAATADQTNAEIRAAVEAASDSNVFTDADHSKLNTILLDEDDFATDSATQAPSQQSTKAYITATSQPLDAELTTLAGMQSGTASILASGTALTSTNAELNLLDGKSVVTAVSGSSTNVQLPTAKAVNDQIVAVINDVGGFVPINDKDSFPETNPDPGDNAGTIISIADAGGLVVSGSGVSTNGDTISTNTTVTINGIDSSLYGTTIAAGKGMLIQTTSTLNEYDYHRLVVDEAGVASAQTLVSDFNERYRTGTKTADDSDTNDDGDLFFDTGANKMYVYDGAYDSGGAWKEVTSAGDYKLLTILDTDGSAFDGANQSFNLKDGSSAASVASAGQLLISVNGVIQKPNSGTSAPTEGFALVDSDTIIFSDAPGSGASVFVTQIGTATTVNVPADNSVSTVKIQNGAVNEDKLASAINTSIAAKAPLASPTFTGTVAIPNIANVETAITAKAPLASPTFTGTVAIPNIANLETAVAANTAKVTNATHTGDVTGSTALTIAALAVEKGMIAADAVDGTKIEDNACDSEHYTDGSVDIVHLANGTDGQIITWDASGVATVVGPGTDGQVLTSTGAGSPPAFEDAASGGGIESNSDGCTIGGTNAGDALVAGSSGGEYNTLFGYDAGTDITTGDGNTAFGHNALKDVITTSDNTAIGAKALTYCTDGHSNVAVGSYAGKDCEEASQIVAIGMNALSHITDGDGNVGIGFETLESCTTGENNVGIGKWALVDVATTNANVAVGYKAGYNCTGDYNTFMGYSVAESHTTGDNCTVIGNQASSSSNTVSNEITLGNSSISTLRCADTSISSLSDRRDKTDIVDLPVGLNFVNTLRPVKFKWKTREGVPVKDGTIRAGFIAQDLQTAQNDANAKFLDLVMESNPDKLEAKYGKLVPVLVQAIQELSAKVAALEAA